MQENTQTELIDSTDVYEARMREYVQSDEWLVDDGKSLRPKTRGVYLCLNMIIPTQGKVQDEELMHSVKASLAKHKIRYNPFNLTIDTIAPNGVNIGVVIDERDFDKVQSNDGFAIANAVKQGNQFRPEEWKEKELKFDCRDGKGGKGVTILNNTSKASTHNSYSNSF